MVFKKFYGKIMLFGEYLVLRGGAALTLPYMNGHGQFEYTESVALPAVSWSNNELERFLKYLKTNKDIDYTKFKNDIRAGLVFSSTLPVGYGVGSSGALVAAVFYHYCNNRDRLSRDMHRLKAYFANMESFFHGSSSGIDPLSCYLGMPLLINKHKISIVKPPRDMYERIFLLNTGLPRSTGDLVRIFEEKCSDKTFCNTLDVDVLQSNSLAIEGFITGNAEKLKDGFKRISELQYAFFREMIPESVLTVWRYGLASGRYYLKICGAGGGGFIIGINNNPQETILSSFNIVHLMH
ncbi:MAG: hypothetical protein R6W78_09785 [Bacteroidales bacterium]